MSCCRTNKAFGDVRDELQGAPCLGSMSPAAVVLHSGFAVAVSAVFSFGSMRGLEAFSGRVGLFV